MAALPLGLYVIVQDLTVPLVIKPQLFGVFSLLFVGPMHMLRCGPLAPVVCRCAWEHASGLGRARSTDHICSPRACTSLFLKEKKEGKALFLLFRFRCCVAVGTVPIHVY